MPSAPSDIEKELVAACLRQEPKAQEMLYRQFYGYAMSVAMRYTRHREDAKDVLNEGFFKVFENLNQFDKSKSLKAWIARIITNQSIDFYRSNLKNSMVSHPEHLENMDVAHNQSPADKLYAQDIFEAVQKLPDAQRLVFNLYEVDGLSHEEVGEHLGISVSTSRATLHRAKQRLKLLLQYATSEAKKEHESKS